MQIAWENSGTKQSGNSKSPPRSVTSHMIKRSAYAAGIRNVSLFQTVGAFFFFSLTVRLLDVSLSGGSASGCASSIVQKPQSSHQPSQYYSNSEQGTVQCGFLLSETRDIFIVK